MGFGLGEGKMYLTPCPPSLLGRATRLMHLVSKPLSFEKRSDEESQCVRFRDGRASGFLAALGMTTFVRY